MAGFSLQACCDFPVLLTLLTVASLFVAGGDAPLDFDVGGWLAIELAIGSWFGQRQVAAGGRLAGLQLGDKHAGTWLHHQTTTVLLSSLLISSCNMLLQTKHWAVSGRNTLSKHLPKIYPDLKRKDAG